MFLKQLVTPNAVRLSTVIVAGSLFLAACAPSPKPTSPLISCYPYQETLAEAKENFAEAIDRMAIDEAVSGALLNFPGDKSARSAMKKAELSGAATDYFKVRYNEFETREGLIVSMRSDFLADNHRLDQVGQILNELAQCRESQYEEILSDLEVENVDRGTALMRKEDVDIRIEQDFRLIDSIIEGARERARDFKSTLYAGFGLLPGKIPGKQKYERYIVLKRANVRSAPSKSGTLIGGLFKGEQIYVLPGHEDSAWQPVAWFDGRSTYIYIELIAHRDSGMAAEVGRTSKIFEIEKLSETGKGRRTSFEEKGHDYRRRIEEIQRTVTVRLGSV
uniref:SH3 domain-containing protein n=1 Tax=Candidatus Kentrum sp. LFY TaxID=2126342 RepID=A0A450U655_9GAMM|nr:MAG: hypothetical protein BECKLFY1418B_GA0070995_100529 [Candidatus Kentron sp. LFY]